MSNFLPILLLAKMQQDRRAAEARARNRRAEEARRAKRARESQQHYGRKVSYKKYNDREYLYKLVSEDEFLVDFFDKVDKKATEIEAKEKHEDLLEIQDLLEDSLDKFSKIKDKQEELKSLGINLSDKVYIDCGAVGVTSLAGSGFGGVGEYGYNHAYIPVQFNGIRVTRENLAKPEVNPYEQGYKQTRAANVDLDAEVERIEKEIKRKELFLKVSPFGREKIQEDLNGLRQELNQTKRDIETGCLRKNEMDTYAALTPEQKAKIGEYYDAIDEYKPIGINISQRINENINKGQRHFRYEAYVQMRWNEAVRQLVDEGVFTEADVKQAEEKLAAMEIPKDHEDIGLSENTFKKGRRDYAKMVDYFYERPKIVEKRKELAEKKSKLTDLKEEAKVIDKTEKLASAFAKDKSKQTDEEQK